MTKPGQHVLSTLRQMIISKEIKAGERITETYTADMLNVSRTPVRIAFRTLEQEGLLEKLERRGYQIREITEDEISGAIEVRGVLEGLAARQATENGLSEAQKKALQDCLKQGDKLFSKGSVSELDLETYHDINRRFHSVIIEASNNPAIATALKRNEQQPFASVNALAIDRHRLDDEYKRFNFAHLQHHAAFDAISHGQNSRAEAIMREHANATLRYAELFSSKKITNNVRVIGNENP